MEVRRARRPPDGGLLMLLLLLMARDLVMRMMGVTTALPRLAWTPQVRQRWAFVEVMSL